MKSAIVKLIDFDPEGIPDGSHYIFDIDGRIITVEDWMNSSASGREFYEGGGFVDLANETTNAIDALIKRVNSLWQDAWAESIQPIHERERAKVVTRVKAETE